MAGFFVSYMCFVFVCFFVVFFVHLGKRHFQKWLLHPLRCVADIESRLDAIEDAQTNAARGMY